MSMIRSARARLLVAGLSLATLTALALVIALVVPDGSGGKKARAATDPAVDFSISSTGCDSSGTPGIKCTSAPNATFALVVNLNHLPSNGFLDGYDAKMNYTAGLTTGVAGLHQTGAGNWPDCVFNAYDFETTPGQVVVGCTIGINAPDSTYVGPLLHLDFTCGSSPSVETITLVHGDGNTDTIDNFFVSYSEAADESLTINCGEAPQPTPTPAEPTATPTPCDGPCPTATSTNTPPPATNTPVRPTATPTPAKACGDVNDSGRVDSVDALLILQLSAQLISSLPNPASADVNHNGSTNAVDAQFILQYAAGLIQASQLRCS